MKALLQRVKQAKVDIEGQTVGQIAQGLLVLLCVERGDTAAQADKLLDKILKLRIFSDDTGKMNRSVLNLDGNDQAGDMLVVSQFTLAANVWDGNRPSFSTAAGAEQGQALYEYFLEKAKHYPLQHLACGVFGADMQITLINDGPVTIPIQIAPSV